MLDSTLALELDAAEHLNAASQWADLPEALDAVGSPAKYVRLSAANVDQPLNAELEKSLGFDTFSETDRGKVRFAAALEARCRMFPGCAPSSLLTLAACAPHDCVPGQTFSQHFMATSLTLEQQIAAQQLAVYLTGRRQQRHP